MPRTAVHETGYQLGLEENNDNPNSLMFPYPKDGQTLQPEDAKQLPKSPINGSISPMLDVIDKEQKKINETKTKTKTD